MEGVKMEEDTILPSWSQNLPPKFGIRSSAPGGTSLPSLFKGIPASNGPSLPKLSGDLMLEVFTHRSVTRTSPNDVWGDNTRLSVLGEAVMRLIVTWCLFSKKQPMFTADQISEARSEFLTDANVDSWTNMCGLKDKVRVSQDMLPSLQAHEESRILFTSFLGAVYFEHGMGVCQDFISPFLEPGTEFDPPPGQNTSAVHRAQTASHSSSWPYAPPPPPPSEPPQPQGPPPPFPPPSEMDMSIADSTTLSGTSPSHSSIGLPPVPPSSAYPNPAAAPIPGPAYLPLFNQTANQRRITVEYPAFFSGPAHAGQWNVQCMVNGVEKGRGSAASKQLAKEEAARQAYFAMGWDARPGSVNYSRTPSEFKSPPPSQHSGQDDTEMGGSAYGGSSHGSQPPSQTPPASMSYNRSTGPQSYPGNYPTTAPPPTAYLPLFNQTATQRRLAVDYPAEFSGPAHAGRWSVKCTVNGVVKGHGQGISKQLAKEEAAKLAWFAMGWGPRA